MVYTIGFEYDLSGLYALATSWVISGRIPMAAVIVMNVPKSCIIIAMNVLNSSCLDMTVRVPKMLNINKQKLNSSFLLC